MIHVCNINLDAINKRHALFESLHTFWSEFSLVGDKRNLSAVSFPGIRVGSYRRLLSIVDAAQICFGNVSSQPYVIEIGEGYNRRSRRHHLTKFRLPDRDHASRRRSQRCVLKIDAREAKILACRFDVSVGDCNFFWTATFTNFTQVLLCGLVLSLCALECRLCPVAILGRDRVASE